MTRDFEAIIQRHHSKARKLEEYAEFIDAEERGDKETADRWFAAWEQETVRLAQEEGCNDG